MKPSQFPTADAAANFEILRRIHQRERHDLQARKNNAVIVAVCAGLLGAAMGLADLLLS